jgi:hypothetical protein
MAMRTLVCIGALWLAHVGIVGAADLNRIDRTIRQEPEYQSQAPKYCLLVFGPEARTRVWLVIDGDRLYVDESGQGDLRNSRRVELGDFGPWFKAGDVQVADGDTRYISDGDWAYGGEDDWLRIDFKDGQGRRFAAIPRFTDDPRSAPIVHMDGPLTLSLGYAPPAALQPGVAVELEPMLGTPGIGKGAFAALMTIPEDLDQTPRADIEFPSNSAGAPPLRSRLDLKWCECCGGLDLALLQVPAEAGPGTARINLSFPDWEGGQVAPAAFEIPIGAPAGP